MKSFKIQNQKELFSLVILFTKKKKKETKFLYLNFIYDFSKHQFWFKHSFSPDSPIKKNSIFFLTVLVFEKLYLIVKKEIFFK